MLQRIRHVFSPQSVHLTDIEGLVSTLLQKILLFPEKTGIFFVFALIMGFWYNAMSRKTDKKCIYFENQLREKNIPGFYMYKRSILFDLSDTERTTCITNERRKKRN